MFWIFLTLTSLFLGWRLWKSYWHPVNVQIRQAETLHWVPAGTVENGTGRYDSLHARAHYVARIDERGGAVSLAVPPVEGQFKSFVEVEQWISAFERGEPL